MATKTKMVNSSDDNDEYAWLDEVEAPECLEFAKTMNDNCLKTLGDPKNDKNTDTYDRVLSVLESDDRIPGISSYGIDPETKKRIVYNFWKDKDHAKGIWRKTTLEEYKKASPEWETVLDVDNLAEKDGISWVWKGSRALPRSRDVGSPTLITRSLVYLSRGGSDAINMKEFDMNTMTFVDEKEAFNLPEAKTRASWKSRDVLLVGSDFGPGSLTDSGYPRIVKEWERGTNIEDAPIVFEGEKTDVSVNGYIVDNRNWGGDIWQVHSRTITFYTSKYYIVKLSEDHLLPSKDRSSSTTLEFKELDIPLDASVSYMGKIMFITLRSDWTPIEGKETYKSGSVIYCPLERFVNEGKEAVDYTILFAPSDRTAYEYKTYTKNFLIVSTLDNVKSKLSFYKIVNNDDDNSQSLELFYEDPEPQIVDCGIRPLDSIECDDVFYTTSGYLTPSTLYLANPEKYKDSNDDSSFITEKLKSLPNMYNADGLKVEQRTAISKDGTEIPYFIVYPESIELNGKNPTLLYGYGGFEISLQPHYVATSGLAWLERGGVYVEANIRGGGEFGPSWHQAALKENRNKSYEDFIAVAEHLIESKICAPKSLCTRGGSNGGLLMGNMYTMRPDLFGAIHCAVPLLDMKKYHTLLAGASWMAEYGDPDTDDWKNFLYKYSPYHNIDKDQQSYPPMLVTTSTRDDRVHPGHARKMVKKILDMGKDEKKDWPIYYYENIEGGHGGAADAKQSAFMTSLAYDFMFDTLAKNIKNM